MKNIFLLSMLLFVFIHCLKSQIICIKCFDQNDSISSGVNNLILNGGFENTTCLPGWLDDCFCPNSSTYNCDISNWICTGGAELTYSSIFDNKLSIVPEGNNAVYFGNGVGYPCSPISDDRSCFIFTECSITGIPSGYPVSDSIRGGHAGVSLEQSVTGLIVGKTYVLEFWAGGESAAGLFPANGLFAIDIGFGNTYLNCKPTYDIFNEFGTRYIIEFNATSVSHTIKFTNWGHICSGCTELVLDNVRLYTVEELSSSVTACITVTKDLTDYFNLSLFPNPFSNEIIIKSNTDYLLEFKLFNSSSIKVLQQEFRKSISINTKQIASGVYFYEVIDQNKILKVGKIIKE